MISEVAENVKVAAISARPTRSYLTGKQTMARLSTQTRYQGKNQGVTTSSVPSVASEATASVRVVGVRHSQVILTTINRAKATRSILSHVSWELNICKGRYVQLLAGGRPYTWTMRMIAR